MFNYAYAQSAAQQPSLFASFVPLILIFIIFYFLLIRPQQKKAKEHKILLDSIKKGDQILTSGGMIGKVIKADVEELTVNDWYGDVLINEFDLSTCLDDLEVDFLDKLNRQRESEED